ncbi:MAG: DUF5011 domain-containing protein [Clostridiales bacterium]|nr:DUF5011 domain-containing protein [Clostridiales bacterium]
MNKLRKIAALLLALCMMTMPMLALADAEPTFDGVRDQSVMAGTEFDALDGITAQDAEGNDLTEMIMIEATPALNFKNGKATPENPGDYELVYSVTDKNGVTGEDYATLTVTKKTSEEVVYKTFDFSTVEVTDNHGWEAKIGEAAQATAALKNGAYVIDIQNPGNGDGDVQLAKAGYALKAADYKIKIWAKATKPTYAHILARNENAEGWETFGGAFNVRITEEIAPLELSFSSPGEGSAELLFNLGKITPNPDNAEDTTPTDFTVTIDKIELYEVSGEEHEVPVYTADFAGNDSAYAEAGDGANAGVAFADGKAVFTIDNYPAEGGVWSVKANLNLGDVKIEKGQKYYYRFTVNAANGQGGEALVESAARSWECRANFNGLNAPAGEDTVVSAVFVAEADVDDPVIRLQIGNAPEGATGNTITISNVEFGKMEGDKETHKTVDAFMPFGRNTANAENAAYPWETFNGTDEDNERGVGVIWTDNGSFFYRIDQGGTVDWHDKLICGYTGNPLTLPADSYFTVEITAKATKPVSCGVFLNPMGGWDPRVSEGMSLTEEFQTFRFTTTDTLIMDMDFELLFQFGSEALSKLGEVTVEFQNITIYQTSVL